MNYNEWPETILFLIPNIHQEFSLGLDFDIKGLNRQFMTAVQNLIVVCYDQGLNFCTSLDFIEVISFSNTSAKRKFHKTLSRKLFPLRFKKIQP